MFRLNIAALIVLLCWIGRSLALVQDVHEVDHNNSKDITAGLSVAGGATCFVLIILCIAAHCGPWIFYHCSSSSSSDRGPSRQALFNNDREVKSETPFTRDRWDGPLWSYPRWSLYRRSN